MTFSLAVVDQFELVSAEAHGTTPDSIFEAGSVSKPVAALVALRLVEDGALDLDADVNEKLVSWQVPGPEVATLRKLLGHTAGLGVDFFPGYPRTAPLPSLEHVLDGLAPATTAPVRFERVPGESFRYSGGGYAILQLLLADATGVRFPELAAGLIFEPLGMTRSTFAQPLPEKLRAFAASDDWQVYPEAAAAGLWTTAADLATFVLSVQQALAGRGGPLTREAALLMTTRAVSLPTKGEWSGLRTLGIEPPTSFGLGLFLDHFRFSHLGNSAGFFCAIVGSLQGGAGAALMMNSDPQPFFFERLLAVADQYEWRGFRCNAS